MFPACPADVFKDFFFLGLIHELYPRFLVCSKSLMYEVFNKWIFCLGLGFLYRVHCLVYECLGLCFFSEK